MESKFWLLTVWSCFYWFVANGAVISIHHNVPLSRLKNSGNLYLIDFPISKDPPPSSPKCGDGSPYSFAFKRGEPGNDDKLVIEFMGGQQFENELEFCWDFNSCLKAGSSEFSIPWTQSSLLSDIGSLIPACRGVPDDFIRPYLPLIIRGENEPDSVPLGLRDEASFGKVNITGWNYLYLPHCTMDLFLGHNDKTNLLYSSKDGKWHERFHSGAFNAKAVMEWVYKNFPVLDTLLFTGCGAGAAVAPPLFAAQAAQHYSAQKGRTPINQIYALMDSPSHLLTNELTQPTNFAQATGIYRWNPFPMLPNSKYTLGGDVLLKEIEATVRDYSQIRFGIFANKNDQVILHAFKKMNGNEDDYFQTYDQWLSNMDEIYPNFNYFIPEGNSHCKFAFSEPNKIIAPFWKPQFQTFLNKVTDNHKSLAIVSDVKIQNSQHFVPSPLTVALITIGALCIIYTIWFIIMIIRKKTGNFTPTPFQIWLSILCRFPLLFFISSLAVPITLSFLGVKSSGYNIDMNFKFDSFLDVDAKPAYFAKVFDASRKDQDQVWKNVTENCQLVNSAKASRRLSTFKKKGEKVILFYENKEQSNVFTREVLLQIRDFERSILSFPGFRDVCYQNSSGDCARFDSPVNIFFDETGELKNIRGVIIDDILTSGNLQNVDAYFSAYNLGSNFTRSTFWLRKGVSKSYLEKLHRELLWPDDQNGKYSHLQFSWSNLHLQEFEVFEALKSDLWWSFGTLSFVTLFILVKLRNPFLVFSALSGIILSFPVAYFYYYVLFDIQTFSLMNFTALFVMLGIGADDIFLMVDSFSHTKVYLGEHASIEDRMKMAYRKAGSTMLVTSLTTSFCFFSNVFSILKIVQEFGLYMGIVIVVNYIHVMTILPSAIVVNEKYVVPLYRKILQSCCGRCRRKKSSKSSSIISSNESKILCSGRIPEESDLKGREEDISLVNSTEEFLVKKIDENPPLQNNPDVELGKVKDASQMKSSKTAKEVNAETSSSSSLDHNHSKITEESASEINSELNNSDVSEEENNLKASIEPETSSWDFVGMNKVDSWFYNEYSPFIYRWRKLFIALFLGMVLSLGISGYFKFEQATGQLVVFKDKYNLGRVMRIEDDHYNDYFQYSQEEDTSWSSDSSNLFPNTGKDTSAPTLPPTLPFLGTPAPTPKNLPPTILPTTSPTELTTDSPIPTPVPTKESDLQSCVPTQVPNSLFYSNTNSLQGDIGDSIEIVCKKLYSGGGTIVCQSDGKWSIIEACVLQTVCPALNIENSNANNNLTPFEEGDKFELVCNEGFTGETTMTCTSNLVWEPFSFFCEPNSCENTEIPNSDKSETDSIQGKTGDKVPISCNDGYRGSGFVTCNPNGQFSFLKCDNTCNFDFVNSQEGKITAITNEEISINCMEGFNGGGSTKCQQDGNFMPIVRCEDGKECPSIFIEHAGFLEGKTGDKVDIKCLEGYAGGGIVTCTDNYSWDFIPSCFAKNCIPLTVTNATQNVIEGKTGETKAINCLEDHFGGGEVTCLSDGNFDTSEFIPCVYKFEQPSAPLISYVSTLKTPPMSVTIEGKYTTKNNIFKEISLTIICRISGINDSSKEVDSLYPDFVVNFTQNDFQKHGLVPGELKTFSCYTKKTVEGKIFQSSVSVSDDVEIEVYPEKPSSIDFVESYNQSSKQLSVIVEKSSLSSWDTTIITQFQCKGEYVGDGSTQMEDTKNSTNGFDGTIIFSIPNLDTEFFVECRLRNNYGWSEWTTSSYELVGPICTLPCTNGGKCNSTSQACDCPLGNEGDQCEKYYCPIVGVSVCGNHGKCETHPGGPGTGNICKCDDGWTGVDCSLEIPKVYRKTTSFTVSLVWGMQSSKTQSNIWNLGSGRSKDEDKLLNPIDIADSDIQTWLLDVVLRARSDTRLRINSNFQTWIEALKIYANKTEISFPVERSAFPIHLNKMMDQNKVTKAMKKHVGTNGVDPLQGDFTYISVDLMAEIGSGSSDNHKDSLKNAYELWKNFLDKVNEDFPSKVGPAVLHSTAFFENYREDRIVATTTISWIVSNGICALIILVFTQNLSLSFWVMATLILMITCLLGLLFAVYSIPFGPVEALGVSVFVGLSSSYILHAVHAYHDTKAITRREKIRETVFAVSSPLSASALSTVGACAFLLACRIYLFVELGILLCTNNLIALIFALVFFVALLSMVGPRQYEGEPDIHQWDFSAIYKGTWRNKGLAKNSQKT